MDIFLKLFGLNGGFETLAAIGVLVMVLEELIDRFWDLDGTRAQVRTLGIGMILGLGGAFFNWGMFADPACCGTLADVWCGLVVGLSAAITANFAFLLPISKALLEALKIRPKAAPVAPVA